MSAVTDLRRFIRRLPPLERPIALAHSSIGPSSAARLQACPGSYTLARRLQREQVILPDAVSDAAARGTQEHALAEAHLRAGTLPCIASDADGLDVHPPGEAALQYIETIAADVARARQVEFLLIEEMLDGRRYHPLLFGTVDGALLWRDADDRPHLVIYDLKSGSYAIAASALQLILYAGMLLLDPRIHDLVASTWWIDTTVVQPRAGGVRHAQHTRLSILRATHAYITLARSATSPYADDLPLVSGPHCLFCPARVSCPARREQRDAKLASQLADAPIDISALEQVLS